jgi:hypothetical protein
VSFIHVGTFAIAMSVRYRLKVTPLLLLSVEILTSEYEYVQDALTAASRRSGEAYQGDSLRYIPER